MRYRELRQRVLDANLGLVRAGLVLLAFGNASAVDREAGVLAIKPSGVPYRRLRPKDIVVVGLADGQVMEGSRRPSSDTPTHRVLYNAFPALGGIVHTHSACATAWAQAHRELPCLGTTHADHFHGPVPVTRRLSPQEIAGDYEMNTGRVIVERFAAGRLDPLEMPAVLDASHGPFTWGGTVEQALENAIALEAIAAMAIHTVSLDPSAQAITQELMDKHFRRKHGPGAYYGQPG